MKDYRKIAKKALDNVKHPLTENKITYAEGHNEKMHGDWEEDLKNRQHSLGQHPAFPDDDESHFEQKIMSERFEDVMKNYKNKFDTDTINTEDVMSSNLSLLDECKVLEQPHIKELEELAINMVRKEYNISEDVVIINAELMGDMSSYDLEKPPKDPIDEVEFESHDDIQKANGNVYKRRLLNAMTQGAAKKCSHMFNIVEKELVNLNPQLPNKYGKLTANADYLHYVTPKLEKGRRGGMVEVEMGSEENPKTVINARAAVFPVLIHELVKGVMEVLSAHGLPEDKQMAEFVVEKADKLGTEPWDERIGPAIWERFTRMIDENDLNLKHNVYSEIAAMDSGEFNMNMREILAGTKKGKTVIADIITGIKERIEEDEQETLQQESGVDTIPWEDIERIEVTDLM